MANWTEQQIQSTNFTVRDGQYIDYYASATTILNGYAGRLRGGTKITVEYIEDQDAMKIINCSDEKAIGKYILSSTNSNGVTLLYISSSKTTTEAKTTTDTKTGAVVPENTDADGNTSSSDTSIINKMTTIDDAFLEEEYGKRYKNSEEYLNNLENGLRVSDLRGILGMPHQFLPTADPRIDGGLDVGDEYRFGRVYSEKIIKHIPLLLMTPGVPTFMAGYNDEQKFKIIGRLGNIITGESLNSIFDDGRVGKYYSLKYAYTEYFHYVNAMLRSAAHFLDIQNEEIDETKIGNIDWLYKSSGLGSNIFSHENLVDFLGPYAGSIAFYADAGTNVDDSFSNSTTESQLAGGLNSLSDKGRELNFLVGNVGGTAGVKLDLLGADDLDAKIDDLTSQVNGILGGSGVMGSILGKARTILAGGRVIFPEIWADSSFSRSYNCSMKLVSPSGDKLSIYLNILVPIYHLLGFTLPRESSNQAYFSPFLVRAYYKGLFNVDMGIIPGLSITKGDEGEWSVDGIPTVANVNFEIRDLYSGLYMSKQKMSNDYGILSNIQELDYIANSCGINVNDHEINRTIRMAIALGFTTNIKDKVTINIFGSISQYFNQKVQNIFGKF